MRRFTSFRGFSSYSSSRSSSRMYSTPVPVTIAKGDGIGPEIMNATLDILEASKANLAVEEITVGEQLYLNGVTSGIDESGWESIDRTKLLLKAPITTPLGKGVKSLNVTMRKTLGLYSNVRPVLSFHPYVPAVHANMDLVVVRENEEDLYAGIEHRQTQEVVQCLKLISLPGTKRIVDYAFKYAVSNNRKKVTCITKSNIMKLTDGTFQKVFEQTAKQYPQIEAVHEIVDISTARIAAKPQNYDVVLTLNLYGDIISDVAAEVAGSVGLAGSANIGDEYAMFEAIHGSAPDISGKDIANPGGLINASVMLLNHVGQQKPAALIRNALMKTLEDGVHTADIWGDHTTKKVGTKQFAQEVIARLGQKPSHLPVADYSAADGKVDTKASTSDIQIPIMQPQKKEFVGIDVFVDWKGKYEVEQLAEKLQAGGDKLGFKLLMISNRGVLVWPHGHPGTFRTDHWRCRFMADNLDKKVPKLLGDLIDNSGLEVIKTENLYNFDGQPGYSLGQGQ